MKSEELERIIETIGKGGVQVAGDLVIEKHVEHEVANVEAGGIGIQIVNNRYGIDDGHNDLICPKDDPVLQLLDELVKDAISKNKSAKHILLPVRAAKEAEVLPIADLAWLNGRYNLSLSPMNWSDWVNKKDANYDDRELNGLILRFQALKTPE